MHDRFSPLPAVDSASIDNRIPLESLVIDFCREHHLCPTLEKNADSRDATAGQPKTFGCVITCYNNQDTILDSLYSALTQSKPFDKIVVVNDASTDGSLEILKNFCVQYDSVEIVHLKNNVGVSAARHSGIQELDTDFITHLDGDDCFWPSKNFHESQLVMNHENAIAFSDILILYPKDRKWISTDPYVGIGKTIARQLLSRKPGVPRDMTFARDLYFAAGGYDLRLSLYEDLDFKFRLASRLETVWCRSDAPAGTIYNRKNPTLSRDEGLRLPRALTSHFFRYVDEVGLAGDEAAEAYRQLVHYYPTDWSESIFQRLSTTSANDIQRMKESILNRTIADLSDDRYAEAVQRLCSAPSFNEHAA